MAERQIRLLKSQVKTARTKTLEKTSRIRRAEDSIDDDFLDYDSNEEDVSKYCNNNDIIYCTCIKKFCILLL